MKDALLDILDARANGGRFAFARADVLQESLACSLEELQAEVCALGKSGELRVLSALPYLMVALKPKVLPGAEAKTQAIGLKTGAPDDRGHSYSFHNQSIEKSKAIAGEDRGSGEGEELLEEILSTLGESDPTTFRGVLSHYSASTIRAALQRVRAIPPERIRKSRTALFRFLLSQTK